MRHLLERRGFAGCLFALAAMLLVAVVSRSAMAYDDYGLRGFLPSMDEPADPFVPPPVARRHHRSHHRWAARWRPLLIAPGRRRMARRYSERRAFHRHQIRVVSRRPKANARRPILAILPPSKEMLFLPIPQRPAIVSIYEDQTLRRGDAVMMEDGIRLFVGHEGGSHRRDDFIRWRLMADLDWQLRKTLDALDHNPPSRWHS